MKIYGYKIVQIGEVMPRGYGLAYREWERDVAVFYPIPFNLIVRLIRELYYRIRIGICKTKIEHMILSALKREFDLGYEAGKDEGIRQSKDLYDRILKLTSKEYKP